MDSFRNRRGRNVLPVPECAFQFPDQLLKMKNSEEFRKEVTASTSSATTEVPEPEPALKPPDPESSEQEKSNTDVEAMDTSPLETAVASITESSGSTTGDQTKQSSGDKDEEKKETLTIEPPATASTSLEQGQDVILEKQKTLEELPSTSSSAMAPNIATTSSGTSVSNNGSSINSVVNEEDDAMTVDSSSDDDEEDVYVNRFPRDNMGSDNNEPLEEVILKRNSEYLAKRCSSLMQRVQGIMQAATARHVSRQLQSVVEHPGLNPLLRSKSTSYQDIIPPSQRITKQNLAELQFSGKLMTNIIRHAMGRSLDLNDDSGTEESETDDDEVVLPDDRMADLGTSDYSPYLPVENNPFMDAVKLEKQYEARKTSLDFSISECDYSLTKSLALRKHCKARKPCFQLEKPSTSSNIINIPVDATSSVKFYHDFKPATIKRVSDMIQRRSSLEDGSKSNGEVNASGSSNCMLKSTTSSNFEQSTTINMSQQGSSGSNSSSQMDCSSQESIASSSGGHSFIPTIKTMGTDGVSVLGVEFVNSSDPTQSASRCAAIKRPDKNRKVFQLGGIQNIFRDPARLPTVLCSCYGRDELCALCLGRAKKKAEINHVYMNSRDKLTVLDETFHKTLSFPEDVPLEALLTPISIGGASSSSIFPSGNSIQKLIKDRSHQFPPDFLDTGPRPKKPRSYDIKPYVESPVRSPKKDNRYGDEAPHSPRKRSAPRKSQSTYEERENLDFAGKGLMGRERKDSIRRTRNQEFDIDNIVIPYSMAATTRVEQLVYKPIETPSWRILEYTDIFTSSGDKSDGELEDMSTATFIHRHNKCEVEERKRFSQALQKAKNSTSSRKTRRLDSTCKSESFDASQTGDEAPSQSQTQSSEKGKESTDGSTTPQLTDNATVITEAMANQALKSLFKVGRRRTISTTSKVEEDEEPAVVYVDPWPGRSFPIPEVDYKDMVEEMHKCFPDCPVGLTSYDSHSIGSSSPTVF